MPTVSDIRIDAEALNALKLSKQSASQLVSALKQKLLFSKVDISCFYQDVATKFIEITCLKSPSLHVTVEIKLISADNCIAVVTQIN